MRNYKKREISTNGKTRQRRKMGEDREREGGRDREGMRRERDEECKEGRRRRINKKTNLE